MGTGALLALLLTTGEPLRAAHKKSSVPAATSARCSDPTPSPTLTCADQPPSIAAFTKSAQRQPGLFSLYRKDGKIYAEIAADQLGMGFLEHVLPANGLGDYGFESGNVFQQPARIVRFLRIGKEVALIWPQTRLVATPNTPLAAAVDESTASSVQALLKIVAADKSGSLLVDLSPLLSDTLDIENKLENGYHFDATRSYFGPGKAFPQNVIVETEQTFWSSKPKAIETVSDPRSVQFRVKYEFSALPTTSTYMPRLADERVGFWSDPHIGFEHDEKRDPSLQYVLRWNIAPTEPTQPLSPAKKPIVWYLDRSIPIAYREPIRRGILEWNHAFERIGISGVMEVKDAPSDASWDPDDFRYNVLRWVTNAHPAFGASAQIVWDPRTGEILRAGVLLDSYLVRNANFNYEKYLGRTPSSRAPGEDERSFGLGMMAQAQFGATALALLYPDRKTPASFWQDYLKAVTLHEIGHDFGLSHNFIAHNAFTAQEIRDAGFTAANGITSSVMEYAPLNLWPKPAQGSYWQTTLGPYDYHAIHWGYARIPAANSPEEETPTLNRWASAASDPRYAFAGDEDVQYDGHAVDPRVAPFMLTNHPIDWCQTQLELDRRLLRTLDARFPQPGQPWEEERSAFGSILKRYVTCASSMTHYIGGEYLSRARIADAHAPLTPLTPVPRALEYQAFTLLDRYLLSDDAWRFPPQTLRRLVYTEYAPFTGFMYEPTPRHDLPISMLAVTVQDAALEYLFTPLLLQRLEDLPYKTHPGQTMTMTDLFTWTQNGIYGDIVRGLSPQTSIRRDLQHRYTRLLATLITDPAPGTPYDAQSLARYELRELMRALTRDLSRANLDLQTRAHLAALLVDATRATQAHTAIPAQNPP